MGKKIVITKFLGTCSSKEIGLLAERYGKPSSHRLAVKAIKEFDNSFISELQLNFPNPYADYTNIKYINGEKILHYVWSAIDYLFKIE